MCSDGGEAITRRTSALLGAMAGRTGRTGRGGRDQVPVQRAAHLHIGSIEIPERGQGSRQSLCAVTDPQGLQMA